MGEERQEKKRHRQASRPTLVPEYQLLQFRVCSLRQADRRGLSVCLSVCLQLPARHTGGGWVCGSGHKIHRTDFAPRLQDTPWERLQLGPPLTRLRRAGGWEQEPLAWWSKKSSFRVLLSEEEGTGKKRALDTRSLGKPWNHLQS